MMSTQCSKHVEEYNKSYHKRRICALSWLITKILMMKNKLYTIWFISVFSLQIRSKLRDEVNMA